jgi:hypothetical protein
MSAITITGNPLVPVRANMQWFKLEDVTVTDKITGFDITLWSLTFTLKQKYGDPTPLINKTVGSGITKTDPTNGTFTVSIVGATDYALLTVSAGKYVFEIYRSDSGNNNMLTFGQVDILPRV